MSSSAVRGTSSPPTIPMSMVFAVGALLMAWGFMVKLSPFIQQSQRRLVERVADANDAADTKKT
jgi:hypothetical protein